MSDLANPYEKFAYAYDRIMYNVDYPRWEEYINDLFLRNNHQPQKMLDLACGTGQLTMLLAKRGYEMWGVDRAEGMLKIARQKTKQLNLKIEFQQGDMRDFDLPQKFDTIVCTYDSINYMINEQEFETACRNVSNHLAISGVFIFDVTTERNIVKHFHSQTFAENDQDYSYIWQNVYTYADKLCRTSLTFFIREGDLFRRFEEMHIQRIFGANIIKKMLNKTGYELVSVYDMYTFNKPHRNTARINFTARKVQEL